ncbi:MAG TPA: arylsulfatase [Blastocatellia bacterium]|nr:arylsulfatase [Blastocatellia bacterium]
MTRKLFRHLTTLVLLALFCGLTTPPATVSAAGKKPNIIFIHADDLGYGDLSCYGQQKFRTPNIDRMANEGTRFTGYYAGSTVCAPSRAALMTGFHTGHAWIRGNGEIPLRPEDVTVAEVLKTAGYRTAVIGKWGLGTTATTGRPDRQGFDESFGFLDHTHAHRQYTGHLWKNGEVFPVDLEKDYAGDLFAQAALDFIGRNSRRPFFLYLAFTVPHAELRAPEDSMKEYRGKFPETPFVNARADAVPTIQPSPERLPSIGYRSQPTPRAAFAAMITRMDRHVGIILARLKELGIDDNTIVFFTSDNGPHKEGGADPVFFNSNGGLRGIKRDLYEGGIRVPMVVRWPGQIKAGRVSDQVWAHWDFLPTAAELVGVKAPAGIDGISMLPALLGKKQKQHEFLYWEFFERGFDQAVRMGDWKAVRNGADSPLELYDLKADRGEQNNVAAKYPEIVKRIEAYLKTARTESEQWKVKRKGE